MSKKKKDVTADDLEAMRALAAHFTFEQIYLIARSLRHMSSTLTSMDANWQPNPDLREEAITAQTLATLMLRTNAVRDYLEEKEEGATS